MLGFQAEANSHFADAKKPKKAHHYSRPVNFVENRIAFNVYLDGRFDYDPMTVNTVYYNHHGRRNANSCNIERDCYGRITRLGNVTMAYDHSNRVRRIGSVFLNYNNYGLFQVGGLQIVYTGCNNDIQLVGVVHPCSPPPPACNGPAVVVIKEKHQHGHAYGHYKNHKQHKGYRR